MSPTRRISPTRTISVMRLVVSHIEESDSMFLIRRASAIASAVILSISILSGAGFAAKSAVVRTKVKVPGGILNGAAITKNRAFFRTNVPEDTLAGIRLGREAKEILAKWGNPSRITVGSSQAEAPAQSSSPAYSPSPMMMPGTMGLPGLPGISAPGATSAPSAPSGTSTILTQEEVTWTYDLQGGITLEFIITDGLITQITVGGSEPWKLSKVRTGLQLGDTYKLALWVCGYPESQKYVGRFLRVGYVNKNRALFTFLNKKLVGITIAMVPSEISL